MDAEYPGSPFLDILDHWATCTANLPMKTTEIILQPGCGSVFPSLKEFSRSVWWLWAWPQHHTDVFASQSLLRGLWLGIQPIQVLLVAHRGLLSCGVLEPGRRVQMSCWGRHCAGGLGPFFSWKLLESVTTGRCGTTELFRLEQTFKIIKSNHHQVHH